MYALEYNSSREDLTISEHGRHVQKLINHAKTIENREKRQSFVESVVNLMHQMNPQTKNVAEYKERLWKHAFRIANYELDVTPPDGVIIHAPSQQEEIKPNLDYPRLEKRFRHYGRNVQSLVRKALEMEEGEKRDAFVEVIGSYMKLAYRTWNKEHYVNDEIIMDDLRAISKGQLAIHDDISFNVKYAQSKPVITKIKGNKVRSNNNNRKVNNRNSTSNRSNSNNRSRNKK